MESQNDKYPVTKIIIGAITILVIAGIAYYWKVMKEEKLQEEEKQKQQQISTSILEGAPEVPQNIGERVYEELENPIENKLPETNTVMPNPLEGLYQNPFK